MNKLARWLTGVALGALCAGIWWVMDYAFFTVGDSTRYIAVTFAYATGYVTRD